MLAIGLILIVLAGAGGAYLTWLMLQNSTGVTLAGGGVTFAVLPITLFLAGAVAMLLLWLGFRLAAVGFRRRRAQRRELKALRDSEAARESNRPSGRETGGADSGSGTARTAGGAGSAATTGSATTTVDRPGHTPPASGRSTTG